MKIRLLALLACSLAVASPAFAQTDVDPGHPRVNEVDQRLQDQQNRVNTGVADGQINAKQAGRDEKRDARVARQAQRDEAKNNGHLTRKEQRHLNHELKHNSKDIHRQRHPGAHPANGN